MPLIDNLQPGDEEGTTKVTINCVFCDQPTTFDVDTEGLQKWLMGMLVQRALPELAAEYRDLLISGAHERCWP